MKLFTAVLAHETNSFSPIETVRSNFHETLLSRPGDNGHGKPLPVIGLDAFVTRAHDAGHDVFVSTVAVAQPSAPTKKPDFEQLVDEIIADLKAEGPFDMVLLGLHGAMMAEGHADCEGYLLAAIRRHVGPTVPVGVLLDLHCNVTKDMLDNATIIMACREYPHTDFTQRGDELYSLIETIASGQGKPVTAHVQIPMLAMFHTPREPMRSFVDKARAYENDDDILQVTLAHGFPWSDFEDCAASVLVTADDNLEKAEQIAQQLAQEFFQLRENGTEPLLSIDEALEAAGAAKAGTVVLADFADNAGGGAASDSTFLLHACLQRGLRNIALALLWDPQAVDAAFAAGEGAEINMQIGGKAGPMSGPPVEGTVLVKKLTTGQQHRLYNDDLWAALGRTALVELQGIEIVLNDLRQQPMHPSAFLQAGCDPWGKRLVIVKSSQHFYAGFADQAAQILYCDAGGSMSMDASARPYKNIRRPIWPLDAVRFT